MAKSKNNAAKQKAAQARLEAEAAEKRRRRIVNIAVGAAIAVVVIALVGGAWFAQQDSKDATQPNADATLPAGVLAAADEYPWAVRPGQASEGAPVLEIWEDFQCPACGAFEALLGPTIDGWIESGEVDVLWRSTSFLDNNFPGDHSKLAVNAWGCAIDQNKTVEYHNLVFANQPPTEGDGWTDDQHIEFAKDVGIQGDDLEVFTDCAADRTYLQWAANGTQAMVENGVPGTPGVYLDGEKLENDVMGSAEAFEEAVLGASGKN